MTSWSELAHLFLVLNVACSIGSPPVLYAFLQDIVFRVYQLRLEACYVVRYGDLRWVLCLRHFALPLMALSVPRDPV